MSIIGQAVITGGGSNTQYKNALRFESDNNFTLAVKDSVKSWNGTIEYTNGQSAWTVWSGTTTLNSYNGFLALRGTGNTYISKYSYPDDPHSWAINGSNVSCKGNIENLLDYQTVAGGGHPNADEKCFIGLFKDCTALIAAPSLGTVTAPNYCYQAMFEGCTSLVRAGAIAATSFGEYACENMFKGCSRLEEPPSVILPATLKYASCREMFNGCSALRKAPEILATATSSYSCYGMFRGCTSLLYPAKSRITNLGNGGFSYMYDKCTSLIALPNLYFTTIRLESCLCMFRDCTNIKVSETQDETYRYPWRIPTAGTGTEAATGGLNGMLSGTGGTFAGDPAINTTYYTDHEPVG